MNIDGNKAFTLTSPMMHEAGESILRECPTGYVLRNAPHVYRATTVAAHVENGAVNPYTLSHWARETMMVVSSEKARLRAIEDENRQLARDSVQGRRSLKAG